MRIAGRHIVWITQKVLCNVLLFMENLTYVIQNKIDIWIWFWHALTIEAIQYLLEELLTWPFCRLDSINSKKASHFLAIMQKINHFLSFIPSNFHLLNKVNEQKIDWKCLLSLTIWLKSDRRRYQLPVTTCPCILDWCCIECCIENQLSSTR